MNDLNLFNNAIKITEIGGIAVKLTNKSGVPSVQGEVVHVDSTTDEAISLETAGDDDPFGVFLDNGIADGEEAWIVIFGKALVKADANGFSRADRIVMSVTTDGRVVGNNAPSVAAHFTEVGHALEDAAANALGKCILHFN